jgi:hypothetical protein
MRKRLFFLKAMYSLIGSYKSLFAEENDAKWWETSAVSLCQPHDVAR